jgi:signal transduction histidine kinase
MAIDASDIAVARSPKRPVRPAANAPAGGDAPRGLPTWSRREIEALLRVSEAVALKPHLEEVLDVIGQEACDVTRANAASVVLAVPGGALRLAAARGLSEDYSRFLQAHFVSYRGTLSRQAVDLLAPVIVDDIAREPLLNRPESKEWWEFAQREGFKAVLSVPLIVGRRALGALNVYRTTAGSWAPAEVEVLSSFAQHAASAIDSAKLIDSQRRQVDALERILSVLRDQTHEYANRLQALSGLLALGETRDAQGFLAQLMTLHHENLASVVEHVGHPTIAGLLLAEMSVSRQRGVKVKLHRQTRLDSLPPSVGDAEAVTIVANLIENAVEAVATMPPHRRRVSVRITQNRKAVTITVRDWGPGVEPGSEKRLFARGRTTKDGHAGIGLALVSDAIASVNGTISVKRFDNGSAFVVSLPCE